MTRVYDGAPIDPSARQDPATCNHPGAHVHAHTGPTPLQPSPQDTGARRAGELTAAVGECGACGSLVASVQLRHPTDGYLSPWVHLYRAGGRMDVPVPAEVAR